MMPSLPHSFNGETIVVVSYAPGAYRRRNDYAIEIVSREEFERRCLLEECEHLFHDKILSGFLVHQKEHFDTIYFLNQRGAAYLVEDGRFTAKGSLLKKEIVGKINPFVVSAVSLQSHFTIVGENIRIVALLGNSDDVTLVSDVDFSISGTLFSLELVPNDFASKAIERKHQELTSGSSDMHSKRGDA